MLLMYSKEHCHELTEHWCVIKESCGSLTETCGFFKETLCLFRENVVYLQKKHGLFMFPGSQALAMIKCSI